MSKHTAADSEITSRTPHHSVNARQSSRLALDRIPMREARLRICGVPLVCRVWRVARVSREATGMGEIGQATSSACPNGYPNHFSGSFWRSAATFHANYLPSTP